MIDPKLTESPTVAVDVDADTLASIRQGMEDAKNGRTVSLEEAHRLIPQWLSQFESQKKR